MAKFIDAAALTQAAATYDPILRTLPYFTVEEVAKALRLNIQLVENEHIIVNRRRMAGGTGPYKPGMTITYREEGMKFYESSLKPELVVCKTRDNITNYQDKQLLVAAGSPLDLKAKKHPLERIIVENEVVSHAEDIVFALFFAERDEETFSPMTAFTGFFPTMDVLVTEGLIAASEKNYATTGSFADPTSESDTSAYDQLVEFIGSAHPMLLSSKGGPVQLLSAISVKKAVRAALRNKLRMFDYPSMEKVLECLREDTFCPSLVWDAHECLGTGSKLVLQKAGNMDIGMNTNRSDKYVQVRNIFEDPNEVQFWIEDAWDTRIQDIHCKKFLTNEQANTAADLAGDYVKAAATDDEGEEEETV